MPAAMSGGGGRAAVTFRGPLSTIGALLLIALVAILLVADWWSSRELRKLGAEPTRNLRGLRIVNFVALGAALLYAVYVLVTR